MNLLIHDLPQEQWQRIKDEYEDWKVISDNGKIRPCIGCFKCWTSGTGECVFNDGYQNMGQLIHEADEVVFMSRYTYGGFSSFVKNVMDRCIGYVLPEFETAYGEMHHQKRYDEEKPVTFRFRGNGLTIEDKKKAEQYAAAVCRNMRSKVKAVIFDEMPAEERTPVSSRNDERSGVLLVNCSLRGNGSNTGVFLQKLQEYLKGPFETVSLTVNADFKAVAEAIGRAEKVVMSMPLYVDGLPSSAVRLMETVRDMGTGKGCKVYALVNNGLYESSQNNNILNMIKAWCRENDISYQGAVAIGAGEVVGKLMQNSQKALWPAYNTVSGLELLAKAINNSRNMDDLYVDLYRFPRWLYILIANTNWQRIKRGS